MKNGALSLSSTVRFRSQMASSYAGFPHDGQLQPEESMMTTRRQNPVLPAVKEVSGRIERSAKQTRIILSIIHNETSHWIAERVAAEHKRTNHLPR